jgi:Na+/H+-translocating membrane pyrophosphatase
MDWVILAPIAAVISIFFGGYLFYQVYKSPTGSERAAKVSRAIAEGANAYLKTLYTALVVVAVVLSVVLCLASGRQWPMFLVPCVLPWPGSWACRSL